MQTIKIFVASSEELKMERLYLADMVENLNFKLSNRGIHTQLVKWEYLEASMGVKHKQEEYNDVLRTCDICLVLYWTRFGMYTKTELDTAYHRVCSGENPKKMYVYFKEDGSEMSPELRAFKESFISDYGHFICRFQTVDTLRAEFLLQYIGYLSEYGAQRELVEISDAKVKVSGQEFADLRQLSFAGNNDEYNTLLKSIRKSEKLLAVTEPDDEDYAELVADLKELREKRQHMEKSLWDTAMLITRLSSTQCSERLQRAMDLFRSGDNRGANAILKEEEIDHDVEHNLRLIQLGEEGKKGLQMNIDEYLLKIQTLTTEMDDGWFEQVDQLYRKCIDAGRGHLPLQKQAEILSDYSSFLSWENQFDRIESVAREALSLYRQLEATAPGKYVEAQVDTLIVLIDYYLDAKAYAEAAQLIEQGFSVIGNAEHPMKQSLLYTRSACIHTELLDYAQAEKEYLRALHLIRDHHPEAHLERLSRVQYHLAYVYREQDEAAKALDMLDQATVTFEQTDYAGDLESQQEFQMRLLEMRGAVYRDLCQPEEAEKVYLQYLPLVEELARRNPNTYKKDLAKTWGHLADIHQVLNQEKRSVDESEKAIAIVRDLFLQYPMQYASLYSGILQDGAMHLKNIREYSKAMHAIDEAIESYGLLKETDAEVYKFDLADAYNLKGCVYDDANCNDEARTMYTKSLEIRRDLCRQFGDRYKGELAQSLSNIALADLHDGRYEESEREYLELLTVYGQLTEKYGEDTDCDRAITYLNLGAIKQRQLQWEEAARYNEQSLSLLSRATSAMGQSYVMSLQAKVATSLSVVYMAQHKYPEGFAQVENAIACYEKLAEGSPATYSTQLAYSYNEYAWLLLQAGHLEKAETYSIKSSQLSLELDDGVLARIVIDTLACIHRAQGEYSQAESEFLDCIEICKAIYQDKPDKQRGILFNEYKECAELYAKMGKRQKASTYKSSALQLYAQLSENSQLEYRDVHQELESLKI